LILRDEVKARELAIGLNFQPAGRADEALRRAKRGDLAAFDELMSRHERQVFRIALGVLGGREDAEDAVQEVFLKFHRALGTLDEDRVVAAWLYRVTVNVCRDMHTKRARVRNLSLEELQFAGFEPRALEADPEGLLSAAEQEHLVLRALGDLPPKERAALVLRDIEGLSTEEVAEALGSSPATVRSQVATARLKLKRFRDRVLGRKTK
jgi:RNA polymerase sigma-70 factor (ECF subfamily)